MRRRARALGFVRVAVVVALTLSATARAQTVTLTPACGKPGDAFTIGGAGWPEPPPPCDYLFFFDGTEFAASQPDGLYGPPNRAAVVPGGKMVGKYPVKIELRITADGSLQGTGSKDFCVVDDTAGMLTAATTGADVDITFKPSCTINCTKIMFIQMVNATGTKDDDTEVLAIPSVWGFAADKDKDLGGNTDVGATRVDRMHGRTQPYYGGDGDGLNNQTMGMSDGCNIVNATMHDAPAQSDDSFPAGFKKRTLSFTTHPFCVAGKDAGKYFGTITWTWMKTKGADAMVTTGAGNGNQPSQAETDGVKTWTDLRMFELPPPPP